MSISYHHDYVGGRIIILTFWDQQALDQSKSSHARGLEKL